MDHNDEGTEFRYFIAWKPVPNVTRWALLVGECVHNLRSALDHAVYECSGPDAPDGCQFPVFRDDSYLSLPERAKRGYLYKVRGIKDDRVRAIIQTAQPWNRKERPELHPLWVLHRLDIQDKHRLLTPVASVPRNLRMNVRAEFFDDANHAVHASGPEWIPFERKAEVLTVRTSQPARKVYVNLDGQYGIGLAVEGLDLGLQSTLNKLSQYTRRLLEEIRDALV